MSDSIPEGQSSSSTTADQPLIQLTKFGVLLVVGIPVLVFLLGPAILSGLDQLLSWIHWKLLTSTYVPPTSRIDLLLAWFTTALFIAELVGFFPSFPAEMTEWLISVMYPKHLRWLVSMVPGVIFMAIGAVIAKKWFT